MRNPFSFPFRQPLPLTDQPAATIEAPPPAAGGPPAPGGFGVGDARWLWLLNSAPIAVLLALLSGEFSVINSLLEPASRTAWYVLGAVLVSLAALYAGYAAWCARARRPLTVAYALVTLVLYCSVLGAYAQYLEVLFPFSVPRWLLAGDAPFWTASFLMPTLAHAVVVLVVRLTPAGSARSALASFGLALAVPAGWYLLMQLVLPLLHGGSGDFFGHTLVVLIVVSTVVFLFFLVRGAYILTQQRAEAWQKYELLWKVLATVVLPLAGLLLNNGGFGQTWGRIGVGLFGAFDGPWFYGLTLLNGALLCCPAPAGPRARLGLLLGRATTLPFTLYFFLVFLPFLPLAVVAILAAGAGFLLLAPSLLLLVHVRELSQDVAALRGAVPRGVLTLGIGLALLGLPLGLTFSYLHDRHALHQALEALYQPDYQAPTASIDTDALANALETVRAHKRTSFNITGARQPYLSTYYHWLVLDNLTLADAKLDRLAHVFLGQTPPMRGDFRPESAVSPTLTDARVRSTYDSRQAAWVSWVDLVITSPVTTEDWRGIEYATTFALPPGAWVQDYYLDIAGRREKGVLSERKAAEWVYSQIRGTSRDPGLLRYVGSDQLELRVFPFGSGERRTTGFCLVHKEPVALQLGDRTLALGDSGAHPPLTRAVSTPDGAVTYLSPLVKQALPLVQRRPYYHFLVDASAASKPAAYAARIRRLLANEPLSAPARFTFVDAGATPADPATDWAVQLAARPAGTGGYNLDDAIRRALARELLAPAATYPLLVTVTDSLPRAVLDADFADLAGATPETSCFYDLAADGSLISHSLLEAPAQARPAAAISPPAARFVRAWPDAAHPAAYLPADDQPAVVLNRAALTLPADTGTWLTGLRLRGYESLRVRQPGAAEAQRLAAIQASFQSGILTPQTAYLALEDDAQKAALRRKQAQTLAGHTNLDADEETLRMSEPGEWLLLALVGAALLVRQWRRRLASAPR